MLAQFQRLVTYWLVYPAKVEPSLGVAPRSSHYEGDVLLLNYDGNGTAVRYCPELAGVRARFFTYKDCEPKVAASVGLAPTKHRLERPAARLLSVRDQKVAPALGLAPRQEA